MAVQVKCPEMLPEGRELLKRMLESAASKACDVSSRYAYHGVHEEVLAQRNKGPDQAHHMRCAGAMAIALLGQLKAEGTIDIDFG